MIVVTMANFRNGCSHSHGCLPKWINRSQSANVGSHENGLINGIRFLPDVKSEKNNGMKIITDSPVTTRRGVNHVVLNSLIKVLNGRAGLMTMHI